MPFENMGALIRIACVPDINSRHAVNVDEMIRVRLCCGGKKNMWGTQRLLALNKNTILKAIFLAQAG